MSAANIDDMPMHLHEWAELSQTAALQRQASLKLTASDLDAADIRRRARERQVVQMVAASIAARRRAAVQRARHRTVWARLRNGLRILWLRYTISSNEQWIADAERGGVFTSANLRMVRRDLEALRVQLAIAEGRA